MHSLKKRNPSIRNYPFGTSHNMGKNDLWIASTGALLGLTLATTDADFLRRAGVTNEEMEEHQILVDIAERIRAGDDDTTNMRHLSLRKLPEVWV